MHSLIDHGAAAVPAGAHVSKNISCHRAQAERIVEFAEGEQPANGRDLRAEEFQPDSLVDRQCDDGASTFIAGSR